MQVILKNKILDHTLGTTTYSKPTLYAALILQNQSEVNAADYVRKSITFGSSTGGVISNTFSCSWEVGVDAWGVVNYVALYDASTGGNMLWRSTQFANVTINPGGLVTIQIGDLVITYS